MKKKYLIISILAALTASRATAQTGADFMRAMKVATVNVPFDVSDEGKEFRVKWGMDTAWNWDFNVNRGIAHIGKGNFETGRISFQPNAKVIDNGDGEYPDATYSLTEKQKNAMKSRCKNILLTGCNQVEINNDQEDALSAENVTVYQADYLNKPMAWYKLIKASVAFARTCGVEVISIAPFNEPDYTAWGQGTMASMKEICRLIKGDPFFDGIRVCGGNTLNCDRALEWYNYCLEYVDEGNTHQLAGSFDNYASFFQKVKADGKVATADELHNVGEAIVGVEYGMETGIWWGFDSKARGQFCIDSNQGVRIGYGEHRSSWTSAAVYRNNQTGEVHGYMGSSERQANSASYAFVSTTKDVFVNGYGPTRMYVYDIPGGTGYQKGQINAERLFDITWGEDVAPGVIDGTYQIMNAYSRKLLTYNGTNNVQSSTRKTSGTTQHWNVNPGYTDGDISYWFIDNAIASTSVKTTHLNLLNNNLSSGAGVICFDAGHGMNEQWYLKYAKNGYYYIINRLSNKYLYCGDVKTGTELRLMNPPTEGSTTESRYLWRFMPLDATTETKAPAAPENLKAKAHNGSVELCWNAPADEDLKSYTVLRQDGTEWNTIGRNITDTCFYDNTALVGKDYTYKVIAVDLAGNRSTPSSEVKSAVKTGKGILCQLQFDGDLTDKTQNHLNASLYGTETYNQLSTVVRSGTKSFTLNGKSYLMIPYSAAHQDEITICTWVRWNSSSSSWQRIFDFGNSTDQYMFLTPSNGSEMRFVMKNKGNEQIISTSQLPASSWHHLAVTILPDSTTEKVSVKIYLDGEEKAGNDNFTIKPSDIAPSLCFIGRSMFNSDPMFNGRIDDFRIYNYALTEEEIKKVMNDTGEISGDIQEDDEPDVLKGDVNEDGKVDISDVVALINQMAGTATYRYADVNEDNAVDISDVVAVINIMAGGQTNEEE